MLILTNMQKNLELHILVFGGTSQDQINIREYRRDNKKKMDNPEKPETQHLYTTIHKHRKQDMTLPQTTGGKDKLNIAFMQKS